MDDVGNVSLKAAPPVYKEFTVNDLRTCVLYKI